MIGTTLQALITQKGTNVNELARTIGVSAQTLYSIIKRDNMKIDFDVLLKICDALDVGIELFYREYIQDTHPITELATSEYPVMVKYRRLTDTEKDRIDDLIDRTLGGQPLATEHTQKKPATNEDDGQILIEKRLLTLFQQIPESSQPFVLDMIEAALKSQGLL